MVRQLEAAARAEKAGHHYLVQHSAGSGKSNSIAWTAHRLQSLHDENDEKVFHSVVVVTVLPKSEMLPLAIGALSPT